MRLAALALTVGLAAGPAVAQTAYAPTVLPAPGDTVCPGGLCGPEALIPLFEALRATETGERDVPVHILQIGDSHTAGDRITGKLRADLQARFGNGGRGVLPAGIPYAGYAPMQVEVAAEGWTSEVASLAATGTNAYAPFGAAGMRGRVSPGDHLDLRFDPGSEPHWLVVCGWPRGPGAGLAVQGDAETRMVDLNTGPDGGTAPACVSLPQYEQAVSEIRLLGVGAGVTLSSVLAVKDDAGRWPGSSWTARPRPGVLVSNLGVIGSTLADFASRDDAMLGLEFGAFHPTLVILAYGTNEGFDDGLDGAAYERLLRGQIDRIRGISGSAPILILGAPDALRSGAPSGCSADGLRRPPPNLAVVRDVQRRVAAEMGVAFWDWRGRMGGDCSADRLATMAEPLMRGDRVHFTSEGADWIGGMLSRDLMAAYDAWKGQTEAGQGE
ncbi:MAG TPA: GDSL-type esterase/lipase family protein [Brevundimonas sp.]